jgi:hypothetical protein
LCDTIVIKDVAPKSIRLCLFSFSLFGMVKQWFYKEKEVVKTWDKCSTVFLAQCSEGTNFELLAKLHGNYS